MVDFKYGVGWSFTTITTTEIIPLKNLKTNLFTDCHIHQHKKIGLPVGVKGVDETLLVLPFSMPIHTVSLTVVIVFSIFS